MSQSIILRFGKKDDDRGVDELEIYSRMGMWTVEDLERMAKMLSSAMAGFFPGGWCEVRKITGPARKEEKHAES